MENITTKDHVETERHKLDNKKHELSEPVNTRIEQHRKAYAYAVARIDSCIALQNKAPSEAAVLREVIGCWTRIRNYHHFVIQENLKLRQDLNLEISTP